jgi:hypothetical protein
MRLPRMTSRLWMAAVAAAEALFTVIYWICCNIELWGYIVLGSILLSLVAPILLIGLSKDAARQVTIWILCILVPTLVVSLASLAVQGDQGFLSNSQGVLTGCVFLIASVGLGYLLACSRHSLSSRGLRGSRLGKVKPELLDDEPA